jgi:ligand-binding sensor domain-containing protein
MLLIRILDFFIVLALAIKIKMMKSSLAFYIYLLIFLSACNSQYPPESKGSKQEDPQQVLVTGDTVSKMLDQGITVLFQDQQDNHWFAGGDGGAYKYDGKKMVRFTEKDGLCNNAVIGIQGDELGNVYFDTRDGVSKYDGQKFTTIPIIDEPASKNEWTMAPGDLWFRMGWDKNGPYHFDGTSLQLMEFPKHGRVDTFYAAYPNASYSPYGIYTIYYDHQGSVWFGTASLGVCRYDGKSISWLYEEQITKTPSGGDFGIRSIVEDKNGYFWFCSSLNRYEILSEISTVSGANYLNYRKEDGVGYLERKGEEGFPYFMSMTEDNNGDLWMVNSDGAWRNDGKELFYYPVKDGEIDASVFSIYKDHQGILWLGTFNAGVFAFNGKTFERFKG